MSFPAFGIEYDLPYRSGKRTIFVHEKIWSYPRTGRNSDILVHMNAPDGKMDVLCRNCGTTFSAFLEHMAEQNQKVVCPKCGHAHPHMLSDIPSTLGKPNR